MAVARELTGSRLRFWLAGSPRLLRGEVHAFLARLPPLSARREIPPILDARERRRRRRFGFAADRWRFAWSHAVLRVVLAHYLGKPAAAIGFAKTGGGHGQPTLLPGARLRLSFSLSHAGEFAAVAVMRGAAIGIDVETPRPRLDPLAIARAHFVEEEIAAIEARHGDERARVFLRLWTAKEAVLKALGTGLARPLSDVVLRLEQRDLPRLRRIAGARVAPRRFALGSLRCANLTPTAVTIAAPEGTRRMTVWVGDAAEIVARARLRRVMG